MESFSPIWVLEEAELTDAGSTVGPALREESGGFTEKCSPFENDTQSPIFTLKGAYSHRHGGSSNEDTGSFYLYWIVIIGSSEMISKLLCLDLCVLYPVNTLHSLTVVNFGGKDIFYDCDGK